MVSKATSASGPQPAPPDSPGHEILAGPILRRLEAKRIVLWLASRSPLSFRIKLDIAGAPIEASAEIRHQQVRVGRECYLHLLDLPLTTPLPTDQAIAYDVLWSRRNDNENHDVPDDDNPLQWTGLTDWAHDLCHDEQSLPRLVLRSTVDNVLHGSCRKPHHPAADGLVAADRWLHARADQPASWPAALLMSGDQVYIDDVAGPMLTAIHELIDELGLFPEEIEGAVVKDSAGLFTSELNYYRRSELLPDTDNSDTLQKRFFEGARKPIFTTANADNHLVTLAEMLAMYLLVWSPTPWRLLAGQQPALPADRARLVFLDTRPRRWRSETNLRHPSGLMDWEALTELQAELLHYKAVILVSPAPVFGVKLIEVVQRVFTLLGKPLLVDAENWMAHKGTANVILNIFSHTKTPANFVILSGDVHYSFVYGIQLRTQAGTPHIWQVTSSGIKNEFPGRLLNVLDRLNRWLYSPRSPLNWFTKRRGLKISPYRPSNASRGERLYNGAGIGHVCFAEDGRPVHVEQITSTATVAFETEGHAES